MSFFDHDGIKRRREERVRLLRKKMEDTYSSYFFDTPDSGSPEIGPLYSYSEEQDEPWYNPPIIQKKKKPNLWLIRILLSFVLLSCSYLLTTWNIPQTKPYKDFIKEVLNRSYDFSAMTAWYENKFGALPAMLPSFGSISNQTQAVLQQGKPTLLKGPVTGTMKPTQTPENGIYLLTTDPLVKSIDRGKVIFIGEKPGLGKTVVVQHSQGLESWYGGLEDYSVSLNDWVEVQQPLGKTPAATSMDQGVYFAIKKDGKFVDPGSVAKIE